MTIGLVSVDRRAPQVDLVARLHECHDEIREFLALATQLGNATQPTEADVERVAAQIVRYFTFAFPLHLADENEELAPRLARRTRELDDALLVMERDHDRQEHAIDALVHACSTLSHEPARHAELARELLAATTRVTRLVEPHLVLEELVIFPALALLSLREIEEIQAAMRARRQGITEPLVPRAP